MDENLFIDYQVGQSALIIPKEAQSELEQYEMLSDSKIHEQYHNIQLNNSFESPKHFEQLIDVDFSSLKDKKMFNFQIPDFLSNSKTNSKVNTGSKEFEDAFKKALKINPEINKYKNFLLQTKLVESGNKNHTVQNSAGAPYYGWFLMGANEIKSTTGLTVSEFRKDPVAQILGAVELYKSNLKTLKNIGAYELGKEQGYSDDALIAGAWLGGPGGVKKVLTKQGDPSDSHWYGGKGGTTVKTRMDEFNYG